MSEIIVCVCGMKSGRALWILCGWEILEEKKVLLPRRTEVMPGERGFSHWTVCKATPPSQWVLIEALLLAFPPVPYREAPKLHVVDWLSKSYGIKSIVLNLSIHLLPKSEHFHSALPPLCSLSIHGSVHVASVRNMPKTSQGRGNASLVCPMKREHLVYLLSCLPKSACNSFSA